jgi:DeoR/GlpR family transcriptional regulator of sugar metabolism
MTRRPEIRRQNLIALLQVKRLHSVDELMREAGASSATLHRDLDALETRGLIRKSYGCVEVLDPRGVQLDFDRRAAENAALKRALAAEAVRLVQPGDAVFIDASSTCGFLLEQVAVAVEGVTVATNSPDAATICRKQMGRVQLIVCGGRLDEELNAFVGPLAAEAVARMRFRKAFVSGAGFSLAGGLSTTSENIQATIRAVLAGAAERYCLVDSTKANRDCLLQVAELREFDQVLTNADLDPKEAKRLRRAGVNLRVV